ncbi:MAG TPA: DUF503 domain-containing protein [Clostridia bacterium]|nr:DUF503 domain-containing protein [Clostridia bacterium]
MVIGVLTLDLYIGGACSLKDKRRVVKSILTRAGNQFNISVAEVGNNDLWQRATIGAVCLSNETSHVHSILSNVVKFVEKQGDVEILDYRTEVI